MLSIATDILMNFKANSTPAVNGRQSSLQMTNYERLNNTVIKQVCSIQIFELTKKQWFCQAPPQAPCLMIWRLVLRNPIEFNDEKSYMNETFEWLKHWNASLIWTLVGFVDESLTKLINLWVKISILLTERLSWLFLIVCDLAKESHIFDASKIC